jgi:uncharacterized protein YndB with AHSA1/START domain
MTYETTSPDTIRKEVRVAVPPDDAFRVFIEQMSNWWPLSTHSVFGDQSTEAILEPIPGGRWFERTPDGRESLWGTVIEAERPVRLLMTFHPGREPDEQEPMHVEVRFVAEGTGTLVTLEHHGWQRCSPHQLAQFDGYVKGWEVVLAAYDESVAA